jgi:hypothetical protein
VVRAQGVHEAHGDEARRDKLTELSPDKSWGLVRGKALEHYEANDGDVFDFTTRWTR